MIIIILTIIVIYILMDDNRYINNYLLKYNLYQWLLFNDCDSYFNKKNFKNIKYAKLIFIRPLIIIKK